MTYLLRRIFKNQVTGAATLRELLQTMFVSEIVCTEGTLWIVSPWISNVVLIDNRSGNFDSLNPDWGRREIRLSEGMTALMTRGAKVMVVTRPLDTNEAFLGVLQEQVERQMLKDQLKVLKRETLHTKGILLSRSLLLGSMNLTYGGLEIHDEFIEYCIDPEDIARTRLEFASYLESDR